MRERREVMDAVVVGGGLAGLAAGERLAREGCSVAVLEASPWPGGVVGSRRIDIPGGSFLFESGPHSVPATARHFTALVEHLGLNARLVTSSAAAEERQLLWRGQLVALPSSPLGLLRTPLVSWVTKLRFLSESRRAWSPPVDGGEPTLHDLVAERFGADAAARVAGAFVRGVYAGEARELGTRSAFPRLWRGLEEHHSILRFLAAARRASGGTHRATLLSFVDGLGELPTALARQLGDGFEPNTRATALERDGDGWCVRLASGDQRRARRVVLATSAPVARELLALHLGQQRAGLAALATLTEQKHNGVRLVQFGLVKPLPKRWPTGFGFLVTPEEQSTRGVQLLGALVPSNVFGGRAPTDGASVSCFYRLDGAIAAEAADATAERAARELAAAIGAHTRDLHIAVQQTTDWRAGMGGIPAYSPGHDVRTAALEDALRDCAPGVALVGSYTHGVSVDDVLEHAGATALRLATGLEPTRRDQP